ncbi:glycine-rich domain-containing protein [Hafnia paralvei]|uniref:glycine-rich domain-containing protein n=1 Tax=Hafnia paralvei TaxID=546367 RepID=UPI0024BB6B2C|nr:hypothetical protein [Hafnia paralvei]
MAKNNFKAFALDPNANVMSQADWEMLPVLLSGFTAGKASSSQVNKALRQSSTIAAVIAQFMADKTGQDVLDNGNTSQLQTIFASAIQGRLINVRVFTSSGTYTPTDGTKSIIVEVQGGGGGGGNTKAASSTNYTLASSGGAGGYAKSRITPVAASYTVTVGSGGQGGSDGGNSIFGVIVAAGGNGGGMVRGDYSSTSNALSLGASGGGATGGNIINSPGATSNYSILIQGAGISPPGADSFLGSGGKGSGSSVSNGLDGTLGGGGGASCGSRSTNQYNGGSGGNGIVIIWEYA